MSVMDYQQILLNGLDASFALEILARTLVMFVVIMLFLRLSGKKGVRQLSLFEVAIVIGMGSAAGNPMVNDDSAIWPALIVFATILIFYRVLTWVCSRNEWCARFLEGSPEYVIDGGVFVLVGHKTGYAKDEFFAEMRQQGVEHVGQVRCALLETNGSVSFHFYEDDKVKPGLAIWPKAYASRSRLIRHPGLMLVPIARRFGP